MDEKWTLGTRVTKIKGSNWTGKVVGFYSTDLTPEGYAVESETERGSVQIYPRAALRSLEHTATHREASEAPLKEQIAQRDALLREAREFVLTDAFEGDRAARKLITQIDALTPGEG